MEWKHDSEPVFCCDGQNGPDSLDSINAAAEKKKKGSAHVKGTLVPNN